MRRRPFSTIGSLTTRNRRRSVLGSPPRREHQVAVVDARLAGAPAASSGTQGALAWHQSRSRASAGQGPWQQAGRDHEEAGRDQAIADLQQVARGLAQGRLDQHQQPAVGQQLARPAEDTSGRPRRHVRWRPARSAGARRRSGRSAPPRPAGAPVRRSATTTPGGARHPIHRRRPRPPAAALLAHRSARPPPSRRPGPAPAARRRAASASVVQDPPQRGPRARGDVLLVLLGAAGVGQVGLARPARARPTRPSWTRCAAGRVALRLSSPCGRRSP